MRIPIAADGLIEAEIVYFDNAGLFMQLGILPEQGSRQERVMQAIHACGCGCPGCTDDDTRAVARILRT